ncbi:MAG: PAS domain S-box protein, partial [Pedobacter sp.]
IPVIFISGKDDVEDKCAAFDAGGVDYVTKPFNGQEVIARVRTHLQLARTEELKREINERILAELALKKNERKLQAAYEELQVQNEELQTQSEELHVQSEEMQQQNQELQRLWAINKTSEESLRDSEQRFRLATEATGVGIWEWNVITNQLRWDQQMFRIYGILPTADGFVQYSDWSSAVLPEDLSEQETILKYTARHGGTSFRAFRILRRNDGECREIQAVDTVRTNAREEIEWVVGTNLDVTIRKKAEAALLESEERFRIMANAIPQLAWIARSDGHIFWYNQRWYDYTGTTPEQMEGWGWQSVHDPIELPNVLERWQTSITSGESFDMTFPLRGTDSVFRPFLTRVIPIKDADGNVQQWFGTNTDVSELKHVEQTLRESEAKFRSLFDNSIDAVFMGTPDGTILSANPAACSMFGMTEEEIIRAGLVGLCAPGDSRHAAAIEERSKTNRVSSFELTFIRKNGEIFPTEIDSVILHGEPQRAFVIIRDISARKEAEQEILDARNNLEIKVKIRTAELERIRKELALQNNELQNSYRLLQIETANRLQAVESLREKEQLLIQQNRQAAMGEMIGNIAHQWRQPLNTLGLLAQRIGLLYGSPVFDKEFVGTSVAKSMEIIKHMSKTIDDFRDYFKPEKDKSDFYVSEAIKNALSLLEGNFQNPKICIEIIEGGNPVVNGYHNEFSQVFLNILNNARDALIEREVSEGKVTITICREEYGTVITVADNAGGIPDEIISKIFDPYFTTKGPLLGTGIGLFMSKAIIEKNMGGKLTVRNTDIGAEFRIEV